MKPHHHLHLNFNPALLSGLNMLDPYGNQVQLEVLDAEGPSGPANRFFVHYVQGNMYEEGDTRQFIILAPTRLAAIDTYDAHLQREHKKTAKKHFDTLERLPEEEAGHWQMYTRGQTFAQWWAAQVYGRWTKHRNFTPDVCIQLTC